MFVSILPINNYLKNGIRIMIQSLFRLRAVGFVHREEKFEMKGEVKYVPG
jgi:hypothetical protein